MKGIMMNLEKNLKDISDSLIIAKGNLSALQANDQHCLKGYMKIAEVYNDMWEETNDYAYENLKDEELKYFILVTD